MIWNRGRDERPMEGNLVMEVQSDLGFTAESSSFCSWIIFYADFLHWSFIHSVVFVICLCILC